MVEGDRAMVADYSWVALVRSEHFFLVLHGSRDSQLDCN